jgi:hypothetical protein
MASPNIADVLQHLVVYLAEQIEIDVVGLEGVGTYRAPAIVFASATRLQS